MKNGNALAVMTKAPVPGQVKTRLVPYLTKRDAAELYRCFIKDIFARIGRLKGIDIFAAYTPPGAEGIIKDIIPEKVNLIVQNGEELGERLKNLFSCLFANGYKKVAVIGSDSPDMPLEYIKMTFDKLEDDKVVFGPADDGGYYLVAMERLYKNIFKNIPWGTNRVLNESLKTAEEQGAKIFLLPEWYDVDRYEDLKRLVKGKEEIPNTYDFIKKKIL